MLKLGLILQIMNYIDYCRNEKIKKVIGLMKDEIGGKVMTAFVGLRAKTYSCLIDDSSEDKKAKNTKSLPLKENLNFRIIKTV